MQNKITCDINTVSRIHHHIHPCLIYEAIMRHIRDKYEAIMKQIFIIFQKMKCWLRQFLFTAKNHYKTVIIDFLIDICQVMHCNSRKSDYPCRSIDSQQQSDLRQRLQYFKNMKQIFDEAKIYDEAKIKK